MDEKIWYIKIDDKEEGPYSFEDLKRDKRITPNTLARKKHHPFWRLIRKIPELRKLFFDDESIDPEENVSSTAPWREELTLEMQRDPSYFFWWLLLIFILVAYLIYITYN
jgi:hypothetical protein